MKKVVLIVEVFDEKSKRKAMKTISDIEGLESIDVNMKDKKFTVTGDIDPITVASKLRKLHHTEILTVGPAKEEKKEEPKKPDVPKITDPLPYYCYNYNQYQPPPMNTLYYKPVVEDDPNECVIC